MLNVTFRFCLKNVALKNKIAKMIQGANCKNCHLKCGKGNVSADVLTKLDDLYKKLIESDSKSLLKKYLSRDIYDLLRDVKTPMGSTLLDCIKSGKKQFYVIYLKRYNIYSTYQLMQKYLT